jgi:hypothetical protein
VEHQVQMDVMSELHSGRENWTFTERNHLPGYLQCLIRVCMDMSHMFYLLVSVFL